MPRQDYQRHTFLGGEVSHSLYERADMDKFSKWFSKAENIRFFETGGFRNRYGFVKIAETKNNLAGESIKFISFSFNDEESFLVEFGSGYARFFRNGSPILVDGVTYEIESPFKTFDEVDIKYAQAGDIVFITHPLYGIYELKRLEKDGTSWELTKFNSDLLPMKEENEDKSKTVSATYSAQSAKKASLGMPLTALPYYNDVSFVYNSEEIFTGTSLTRELLLKGISAALKEVSEDLYIYSKNDFLYIEDHSASEAVPADFAISYKYSNTTDFSVVDEQQTGAGSNATATVSYASFYSLDSLYVLGQSRSAGSPLIFRGVEGSENLKIFDSIDDAVTSLIGKYGGPDLPSSIGIQVNKTTQNISYSVDTYAGKYSKLELSGKILEDSEEITNNSSLVSGESSLYDITSSDELFFNNLKEGDTFVVKQEVGADALTGTYSTNNSLGPVISNGKWRLYTTGNWVGKITLKYSTNNGATWVDYMSWVSSSTDEPYNPNTSGTVESDNVVHFKVDLLVTNGSVNFFFSDDSYYVNSYYKILFKTDAQHVTCECVRNDVGEFASEYRWRMPAFSDDAGYPQTIAFYQNRLFFAKDYIVYGSKSDDFWDFYEPIKVSDSDPITLSLLSTEVNNIKNMLTQRSFFIFTGGGEFAIGSEGALTQKDRYLKQFSSNGSASCLPVLISDVVLFVDKSYNSVRALKYTLESDGYEATDITLAQRYLLKDERIISTEQIFEEKEALFLSNTGIIWVLKYINDQNVLSWSHWKHAYGKITNICVVPNGAKHDLYIAVEYNNKKWIEKMDSSEFFDTVEYFQPTQDEKVTVTGGKEGDKRIIYQNGVVTTVTVDANGQIPVPEDHTSSFKVGAQYTSIATLLSPTIQQDDYTHSTYRKKLPYKVYFYYTNSYGFTVGIEEDEKMNPEFNVLNADVDDENALTSGKESVLIPSRFEHSGRVSFVQESPYPMEIQDVLIETDFGGQ